MLFVSLRPVDQGSHLYQRMEINEVIFVRESVKPVLITVPLFTD